MLGVDHDKNILLSTPFPTIPMLGTNCWCNVIMFYVGNNRCCIVLYCIVRAKTDVIFFCLRLSCCFSARFNMSETHIVIPPVF